MEYVTDCPGPNDGGGGGVANTASCIPLEIDFGTVDAGESCCTTGGISIIVTE